jgi:CDP-paratose 2-epimerase
MLAAKLDVLPCFSYTPPSLGEFAGTNAAPRNLNDYSDFVCYFGELLGRHYEWAELWNEPDNHREWNPANDTAYAKFAEMVGTAAWWGKKLHGHKMLLGGLANADPNFLSLMHDHGHLEPFDAVGVHGFPHSFEFYWEGWAKRVHKLRERLDWCGSDAEIWITETGYSTWRHDEQPQLAHFIDAAAAPVERVYWYCLQDLSPDRPTVDGFHSDEREYHFGLKTASNRDKLLGRLWRDKGVGALPEWNRRTKARAPATDEKVDLVIGGAGFVGVNTAARLASEGRRVLVYDNLSRPGVEDNLAWLQDTHGDQVEFVCGDVLDEFGLKRAMKRAKRAFHFAAQVAVTTSLDDPEHDYDVNCRGTFNVLQASRAAGGVPLVFTSTNKVYGGMDDVPLELGDEQYAPADAALARFGVGENRNLDFHSPYGCSKGAADQYVIDYARCMNVPAIVFRMSCIYGPHQCGTEDQGWVAHFARAGLSGDTVNLFGDGCQVRDVLFVDDLVDALLAAHQHMPALSGRAFNIGGGPKQAVSLLQVLGHLETALGDDIARTFGDWRPGDQRWYVSDHRAFTTATGWHPKVRPAQGLRRLLDWQRQHLPVSEPVAV